MRRCRRTFLLRSEGGVTVRWECGAHRDFPNETAVDVEYLRDHLSDHHHHKHHLHHKE